jgi:hypothetical protein
VQRSAKIGGPGGPQGKIKVVQIKYILLKEVSGPMKSTDEMILITEEETEKIKKFVGQCTIVSILAIFFSLFFLIVILSCVTVFDDNPRTALLFGVLIGFLAVSTSISGIGASRIALKKVSMVDDDTLKKKARLALILSFIGLGGFIVVIIMISIFFFGIYINEIIYGPP